MGHLTTLGEERVKGGAERERKAFGWGSTWTGSRLFGARRWQLSSARLREARGTDRKSMLALQRHRQNAQSKQQRKFALVETNSQLCSFKASVYKSKLRLRQFPCTL